ncbi:MAG: hypothetical protein LBR28_03735 [Bacteroidales bacterium]|jgi:hypothetical protein|nr:hypothetical protein [Bacteroidales bacterium]
MKRTFLILIYNVIVLNVFAQNIQQQTSLQQAALKGRVKSVREQAYTAYENENKITKKGVNAAAKNTLITYNQAGFQTEFVNYKVNGLLDWRYTSSYNDNNLLQEEKTYNSFDSMILHSTYTYIGNNISKGYCYKSDGSLFEYWIYYYNSNQNLIEQRGFIDTSLFTKWIFKYDSANRRIEKAVLNNNDSIVWLWNCQYLENGLRIETQSLQDNTTQWNYFDGNGILKKTVIIYDKSNVVYTDIFEYSYDSHGNWTECRAYRDEALILITERQYVYY